MDKSENSVSIERIVTDLEKKFTGDANHDLAVIQEYCRTLPPCEESAKVVAALGKYASEKFPDAEAFKIAKRVDEAIKELEKQFTDDDNHNVQIIQDYCRALPKDEENFRIAMTLGQYAAARFPEADEVKKSRAEFEEMNAKAAQIKQRVNDVQETIKAGNIEQAIADLRSILDDVKPPADETHRLISFSNPFEEVLFSALIKESRPLVRISNLNEMLTLQLGSLLAQTAKFDEAREAFTRVIELNPVSAPANLELANILIHEKNYEAAFEQLQNAYPLLYSQDFLTFYFYLLAVVVENLDKNYELAAAYANLCLVYHDNGPAHEMLERLAKDHHVDTTCPSPEEMKRLADDANLPIGPHPEIAQLALQAARQIKAAQPEIARQFFQIAYDLTGQDAILKEMK